MTQHRLSLLSSENPTSPRHMCTSTPSTASTFSGQALCAFYPETTPLNNPCYQEEPNRVLAKAISNIGGFNVE
jgi:hypothetical protein